MASQRTSVENSNAGCFATTRWTVVLKAGGPNSTESFEALTHLCNTYWYPLYSHARRRGCSPEDAADLTQEFFRRFLEKGYFTRADPVRGKFRSFLLTSLNNFLAGEHTRSAALKRGGARKIVCLDEECAEQRYQSEALSQTPSDQAVIERAFDRNWALAVMRCALDELEEDCERANKTKLFRALRPFLARESDRGEYARIGENLGLSGSSVAMAVHRLRERYRYFVRQQVAETVGQPAEVDEEMHHLIQILAEQT